MEEQIGDEQCKNNNPKENDSDWMCFNVDIPECIDKTVYCSKPPYILNGLNDISNWKYTNGTKVYYECINPGHFFDYSVGYTGISKLEAECTSNG